MKNGVAFISPTWHQGSGRGPCVGSSLSRAKGEEHRGKMTTLCLSSKSSGGVKVFHIKLENLPWQLQTMSLFCCKSPQLPNGTGRAELMGLSTPWKVAATGIGGGNLMSLLITGCRMKGLEVTFCWLRKGHFSFSFHPIPSQWIYVVLPSSLSLLWPVPGFGLSFCAIPPAGRGTSQSCGRPLKLCLKNLSLRRAGPRKLNRQNGGQLQALLYTSLRHIHHAIG